MKEHLEYQTAEDIDDLVIALYDLMQRMDGLRNDLFACEDADLKRTYKRSLDRLNLKRDGLLRALNEALSYLRNA